MSKIISLSLMGIGVLLLLSSFFETGAVELDRQALASYHGGTLKYCIGTFIDPSGQHCDDCLPNGNNGFVKCSSVLKDMAWMNVPGQSPAQVWDESTADCEGDLLTYSMFGCFGNPDTTDPGGCLRQYNNLTFVRYDSGVNCP